MPAELSRSPQVNELLRAVDQYAAGAIHDDAMISTLELAIASLEATRQVLDYRLRITPPTSVLAAEMPHLLAALDRMALHTTAVSEAYSGGHVQRMQEAASELRLATDDLFASSDRFDSALAQEPVLSSNPRLEDLMRVGSAVSEGLMEPDIFAGLLAELMEDVLQDAAAPVPSGPLEATWLDMHGLELGQAKQSFLEGLQEAEQYLTDGDASHIQRGLEQSNQAGESLLKLREAFGDAIRPAPPSKPCVKCGADNPLHERRCQKCQAMLPQRFDEAESRVDLHEGEGQIQTSRHSSTPITQDLVNVVGEIQAGTRPIDDLLATLEPIEKRMNETWETLQSTDPVGLSETPEDLDALKWAHQQMETGLQEMSEGIAHMRMAVEQGNSGNLDMGLDAFRTGADKVIKVQMVSAGAATPS